MLVSPVPKADCFLSTMLISVGNNQSDEDKEIWTVVNVPVINQLRQSMVSVIFTIHEAATIVFGGEVIEFFSNCVTVGPTRTGGIFGTVRSEDSP